MKDTYTVLYILKTSRVHTVQVLALTKHISRGHALNIPKVNLSCINFIYIMSAMSKVYWDITNFQNNRGQIKK